jgi:hypothetical protein
MSYAYRQDAKTIVKLEPESSDKFIEIAMFGNVSRRFWVAFNKKDSDILEYITRIPMDGPEMNP